MNLIIIALMNLPVFEHTVSSLREYIRDESESLQRVSELLKYDPGLYFSLLNYINSSTKRGDVTSISQAISLVGAQGLEKFILRQDEYLDEDYLLFWCYAALAGETAVIINEQVNIANEDEVFFAGILPSIGMLMMLIAHPRHKKIVELLLKLPVEQRIFIEEGLYKTNHIEQLDKNLSSPEIYRDIVSCMMKIYSKTGQRNKFTESPSKLSIAHKSFQMFRLVDTAGAAARAILFPAVVEAQEKFSESAKAYFRIAENEIEELLSDVVLRFDSACKAFKMEGLFEKCTQRAASYVSPAVSFETKSKPLAKIVEGIYEANGEGRNIFIYGDSSVGKRLLALSLHRRSDSARKNKPLVSVHCAALDSDTFEMELCGEKGCLLWVSKHKGALEMAEGGTLLLTDIDMIPLMQQDSLAKMLTGDRFHMAGDAPPPVPNIQVLMTSRKDIVAEAKEGRFSDGLLKVLNPVCMYLPPLRERREDIEFIADEIIKKYELNLNDPALRMGLRDYYETQPFNDNLRDLKRFLFFLSAKNRLKS
ncbi:MAG: sigma 54-interacting transcriptional regulator [Nitrospirae bacterium]|nr:sigma 54-interacting transcriptional regulator [Nitrospirota bacterium]